MSKRGQGLPLNTIIIAAIVLIVLVVLIVIFSGRIGIFGKSLDQCPSGPDACQDTADCDSNQVAIPMNCNPDNDIDYCCTPIGDS